MSAAENAFPACPSSGTDKKDDTWHSTSGETRTWTTT